MSYPASLPALFCAWALWSCAPSCSGKIVLRNATGIPLAGGSLSAPGAVPISFSSLGPGTSAEITLTGYREGSYAVLIRWPDGSGRADTLGYLHPDLAFADTLEFVGAGKDLRWKVKQHPRACRERFHARSFFRRLAKTLFR